MARAIVGCPFCGRLNRIDLERAGDGPKCGECSKPILIDRPIALTDDNFDRVIAGSDVPVLVDFYADWCGPCKMMAPVLDQLARDRLGEVLITKLDTDRNQQTARRFDIRGIPTMIVFRNGAEAGRQVGAAGKAQIEQLLAV